MASKTIYGTTSSNEWTFRVDVYETSQSIENNTSVVRGDIWLGRARSSSELGGDFSGVLTIDGQQQAYSGTFNYPTYIQGGGWLYVATKDFTVTHNADGSKTIGVSCSWSANFAPTTASASGDLILDTIPRASSVIATDCYIESATIISINRASSNFTHTLTYYFMNLSGVITTKTSDTIISWTVPQSFYAQIPYDKTKPCAILCQTYSGDTLVGEKTTTFNVTVNPTTNSPTVTGSVIDSNSTTTALTGDNTKLVKYYSTAQITYSATAKNSAIISNISINGTTVSSNPYSISNVDTNNFNITATDSRGYASTLDLTPTMVDYIPLTINANFYRTAPTTGQVSLTFNGNYFNGSFGSQSNILQLKWYYKLKNDSNWTLGGKLVENTDYVISGNSFHSGTSNYETPLIIGSNFTYTNFYDFKIEYNDKLITNEVVKNVTKGQPVFFWNEWMVKILEDLYLKNGVCVDDLINGLIPKIDQQALADWDNLYTQLGITMYLVYDYFGNKNMPNGAYEYGMLIVICSSLNATDFKNVQIYIPDMINTSGIYSSTRLFVRCGTQNWAGFSGNEHTKKP